DEMDLLGEVLLFGVEVVRRDRELRAVEVRYLTAVHLPPRSDRLDREVLRDVPIQQERGVLQIARRACSSGVRHRFPLADLAAWITGLVGLWREAAVRQRN